MNSPPFFSGDNVTQACFLTLYQREIKLRTFGRLIRSVATALTQSMYIIHSQTANELITGQI